MKPKTLGVISRVNSVTEFTMMTIRVLKQQLAAKWGRKIPPVTQRARTACFQFAVLN
jgi:hypothetical protein